MSPSCLDIDRVCGVLLELCPDPADMDINCPGFNIPFVFPYGIEEMRTVEYLAPPFNKIEQKPELRWTEIQRSIILCDGISLGIYCNFSYGNVFFFRQRPC